ncbi:MAG: ribosomal RNA small subunit methyltransferase A [Ignavibacteriae bacterium]|nr:ribosomal RNA small subunit methyltransferase A [Ignavibacteriota bacterium]
MGIKPLKKFGQNYLVDKNTILKMIDVLNLVPEDQVIEIGPGKGSITDELTKQLNTLLAVEIDTRVIDDLRNNYNNLILINSDFTKVKLSDLGNGLTFPTKIIGNIPFNLTGKILFKFLDEKDLISEVALLMPFDIAKRMVAKKRTKEYGILTILFGYFSTTKISFKVSRNVFIPKPNVESAVVSIKFDKDEDKEVQKKTFIKVVKASFGNRRKTLKNSLMNSIFKDCDFSNLGISLQQRAEELEVEDFIELTKYIQKNNVS